MPPAQGLPGRIGSLDGLRGVAILAVIAFHADAMFGGQYGAPGNELMSRLLGVGWLGVQLFFVLSGFLITSILLERKRASGLRAYVTGFYLRRASRILPLYFGFLTLYLVVLRHVPDLNGAGPVSGADASSLYLFYYNFRAPLHPIAVVNLYWSLCVEEQFYLLWPFAVWFCRDAALKRLCVALAAGALLFRLIAIHLAHGVSAAYFMSPGVVDGLAIGALVALFRADAVRWARLVRGAAPVAGALALVLVALAVSQGHFYGNLDARYDAMPLRHDSTVVQTWGVSVAVLLFGAVVAALVGRPSSLPRCERWLSAPVLRSIGFYSYAMYIFHRVVLHELNYIGGRWLRGYASLPPDFAKPALIVVAVAVSYALARVSFAVWEAPFLKLSARYARR